MHHVTASSLVAAGLPRATAFRWHAAALASGDYPTATLTTTTATGAKRAVRALVLTDEEFVAVRATVAAKAGLCVEDVLALAGVGGAA